MRSVRGFEPDDPRVVITVIDDDSELHENYFEGLSYHYLKDRDPENLLEVDGLGSHAQKFEEISVGVEQEILVPNFHIILLVFAMWEDWRIWVESSYLLQPISIHM
eukprot:symbB.v1.2.025401.t1/scaffold2463.1/size78693/4